MTAVSRYICPSSRLALVECEQIADAHEDIEIAEQDLLAARDGRAIGATTSTVNGREYLTVATRHGSAVWLIGDRVPDRWGFTFLASRIA